MSDDKTRLNQEVPHANLIIGVLLGALLLAFTFLAGSHYATSQLALNQNEPQHSIQATPSAISTSTTTSGPTPIATAESNANVIYVNANGRQRALPTRLSSNLMNLDITWVNPSMPIQGPGGGITHYEDSILIGKAAVGSVYRFNQTTSDFYQLGFFLPITNQFKLPATTEDGRSINPLRYTALEVFKQDGKEYMLSFYGYYNVEKNCRTVRLAQAELPRDWLAKPTGSVGIELEWRTLFEASPCLDFTGPGQHVTGYQEGGAILRRGNDVYFTTGDMGRDGIANRVPILTQSQSSDFGRLFHLDLATGDISRIASGLRNTPSLTFDSTSQIWGVDIGPQGGDELNLLDTKRSSTSKNYGWPYATFGVDYTGTDTDLRRWPYSETLGKHIGYEQPKFYWPVAVTPGGLASISDFHPSWDGDLIVAALTKHALIRLSMHEDQVIGQEVLALPARLKSVINTNKRIYFLTDAGWLGYLTPRGNNPVLSPERIAANQTLTQAGCAECHSNPAVPSLAGIWNRDIGSQSKIQYSNALKAKQGQWSKENLRDFLSDPQTFAPGALMPNPQLSPEQTEAVIEALVVPH